MTRTIGYNEHSEAKGGKGMKIIATDQITETTRRTIGYKNFWSQTKLGVWGIRFYYAYWHQKPTVHN